MTTVITRLYADENTARSVADRLSWEGLPQRALQVVTAKSGDVAGRLERAEVSEAAAPIYADRIAAGSALLIVSATYKPLGAARITREMLARTPTLDIGNVDEERFVPDRPDHAPSVLKDHPRFFTMLLDPGEYEGGPITGQIGMRLLSTKPRRNKVMRGGRYMSKAFWPQPLISKKQRRIKVMHGTRFMSKAFWPMPLIWHQRRTRSVIRGGGHPFSRALGWPTISTRV